MARAAAQKLESPKSSAQQLGSIVKSCRDIMRKDKGLNGDLAGCGKTRFQADAVPGNSLVSTARPDKKKACAEKTSNSWTCSATSAPSSEFRTITPCALFVS